MSNLTLAQEQCLNLLRYLAPLFRRMGREVVRYGVFEQSKSLEFAPYDLAPRGFRDFVLAGFQELFPQRWTTTTFSGAIIFDAITGEAHCHRYGSDSEAVRYQAPDWPVARDGFILPDEVAALFDTTLGPNGLPGVLADWIDEHTGDFGRFTQVLRHGRRLAEHDTANGVEFREFRYRIVSESAAFWTSTGMDVRPPHSSLIGIGLFANGGLRKKWEFVLDREQVKAFGDVAAVWHDFPGQVVPEDPDEFNYGLSSDSQEG